VPPVVASAPFCAFCGTRHPVVAVVAPDDALLARAMGGMPMGAPVGAAPVARDGSTGTPSVFAYPRPNEPNLFAEARANRASRKGDRTFTASCDDLCMTFDPQLGFVLVGVHAPDEGPGCVRAYDVQRGGVLWEALGGQRDLGDLGWEQMAVHGRNAYVSVGRSLHVLDLATGQPKWGAEFSDKLTNESGSRAARGLSVLDPFPAGQRGAVLAIATDYSMYAFDRDSGQALWREVREHGPGDATVIPEVGLLYFRRTNELMNPFFQKPVGKLGGAVERCDVEGRCGILQVENWGWRDREGISLHDFATGKEIFFEAADTIDDDVPSVMGQGRVFCALEGGAKLFAAPHGKPVELLPAFRIHALAMCGPTLFVLLRKEHGTSYRRILGVDPATLGVRFDLGELTTEPNDDWTRQMCSNGQILVLVTSPTNDDDDCALWGVDPGGRVVWRLAIGEWRRHYFAGGLLVVQSRRSWKLVRPEDGIVVAEYT
jgi:hypothetical protein